MLMLTVVPTAASAGAMDMFISAVAFTVSGMEYATTYVMTLDATFVDQAGNEATQPHSVTFVTEDAPSVGLLWPTSNQTISDAPVDIGLWLAFDETITTILPIPYAYERLKLIQQPNPPSRGNPVLTHGSRVLGGGLPYKLRC